MLCQYTTNINYINRKCLLSKDFSCKYKKNDDERFCDCKTNLEKLKNITSETEWFFEDHRQ